MTTNVTDILCLLSFFGMLQLYLLFPIVIARGCQWLPWDIFMARDLRWPRYGYMFNLSMTCLIIGFLLQSCVYLFIPMALSQQTTIIHKASESSTFHPKSKLLMTNRSVSFLKNNDLSVDITSVLWHRIST